MLSPSFGFKFQVSVSFVSEKVGGEKVAQFVLRKERQVGKVNRRTDTHSVHLDLTRKILLFLYIFINNITCN
jgi:hypothetical protein